MDVKNQKSNLRMATTTMTTLAILMAAEVVLNILEIHTASIKINLSFIPVVIAAYLFGAAGGIVVYGLGDILGCIIHPMGAWYPPITITYALIGAVFGLLLKNNCSFIRIIIAVFINQFIISLFITTLWISILGYNTADTMFMDFYFTKVVLRLWQIGIMTAVELIIIPSTLKAIVRIPFVRELSLSLSRPTSQKSSETEKA